jgi:hypothetical protein
MMKRSLQQQNSAGEGRAAKTPRVMRALTATTATEGEQDHHHGSLPVVRSLTGAFREQPPASPHQGKRPQDSSIHSPSRDSTKGRGAAAVGPSPRKGRAQGRLPPMATILQDSIVDSLIRYLANKENFVSTLDILAEFKRFTERSNIGASALANTAVVAGDSAFEALKMLITLQSLMADTVRKQYLIPVENLTPNGLLPNHHGWSTLKANNAEGHRYITEILNNINTTTTAAFEKGSLLFDPVSIAFFVAIQTLHVQFDKQAARAPFMEFTCQGLALVSPPPLLFYFIASPDEAYMRAGPRAHVRGHSLSDRVTQRAVCQRRSGHQVRPHVVGRIRRGQAPTAPPGDFAGPQCRGQSAGQDPPHAQARYHGV